MGMEQDYIMRMIKELVKMLGGVVFQKRTEDEKLPELAASGTEEAPLPLIIMADEGLINEAENLLFEKMDGITLRYFQDALSFYEHLSQFDDEYLEAHQYSKEEVVEGLKAAAAKYGFSGIADQFLP